VEFNFNPEKIERLLVNLFKNSLAALDYKPGFIKVSARRVRRWVHFTVEDNAGGIPPVELKKIFHPFYTTSQDGRGSGLGLSISHSIVKQHGGRIRVRSSGGRTRFYVSLPVDP
ncbi:MAG: HAMP domain-containing histidine kinase, partial [Spirochaetia bacterium]|nr:HAMP domain-containing histidine kinase [Spirochaetia bacterium]